MIFPVTSSVNTTVIYNNVPITHQVTNSGLPNVLRACVPFSFTLNLQAWHLISIRGHVGHQDYLPSILFYGWEVNHCLSTIQTAIHMIKAIDFNLFGACMSSEYMQVLIQFILHHFNTHCVLGAFYLNDLLLIHQDGEDPYMQFATTHKVCRDLCLPLTYVNLCDPAPSIVWLSIGFNINLKSISTPTSSSNHLLTLYPSSWLGLTSLKRNFSCLWEK